MGCTSISVCMIDTWRDCLSVLEDKIMLRCQQCMQKEEIETENERKKKRRKRVSSPQKDDGGFASYTDTPFFIYTPLCFFTPASIECVHTAYGSSKPQLQNQKARTITKTTKTKTKTKTHVQNIIQCSPDETRCGHQSSSSVLGRKHVHEKTTRD
ncbi:hypothetical protein GQ42DRAFT_2840 [Ramicandelaber brevisporus]|nr:hypothetical protein GQ42DRAFT_2840 [Ramicandelaber brevisporus]